MKRLWAPPFLRALVLCRVLEFVGIGLLALPLGELLEKSHFEDVEFEEEGGLYLLEFLRFARATGLSPKAIVLGLVLGGFLLLLRAPVEFFATFPRVLSKSASDRLLFGGKRLLLRLAFTLLGWLVLGLTGYLAFSRSGLESDPTPKLLGLASVAWIAKALTLLVEFGFAEADLRRSDGREVPWLGRDASAAFRTLAGCLGVSLAELLGPLAVLWLSFAPAGARPLSALVAEAILCALVAIRLAYLRSLASSSER